jgi:hypothetical protein
MQRFSKHVPIATNMQATIKKRYFYVIRAEKL